MIEKIVNTVYITGGLVLLMTVVMTMNSCGMNKEYHLGTGKELNKSGCSGNYIHK